MTIKKIALSAGHNVYNNGVFDNGAISPDGKYVEAAITKETVRHLVKLLSDKGYVVKDVTPYNERFTHSKKAHEERSRRVNAFNPDIYLDIHINAGGGTGSEVLVYKNSGIAFTLGSKITTQISKDLSIRNRGVKIKPGFWSLSLHRAPSIIVEGGFVDSPGGKDMKTLTPKKYAEAIAKCFKGGNKMPIDVEKAIKDYFKGLEKLGPGNWSKEAIDFVTSKGLMSGYEDGSFKPKKYVTREELAQVLYNIIKE